MARIAADCRGVLLSAAEYRRYLPPDAYRPVRDHFRSVCPWGTCTARVAKGEYPDDYCYTMSAQELDQMSPMTLHFEGGVTLGFGPRQVSLAEDR